MTTNKQVHTKVDHGSYIHWISLHIVKSCSILKIVTLLDWSPRPDFLQRWPWFIQKESLYCFAGCIVPYWMNRVSYFCSTFWSFQSQRRKKKHMFCLHSGKERNVQVVGWCETQCVWSWKRGQRWNRQQRSAWKSKWVVLDVDVGSYNVLCNNE